MDKEFHQENRQTLYQSLEEDSLVLFFSGSAPRKSNDDYYPFFANRNFIYLTGVEQAHSIVLGNNMSGENQECLFMLPSNSIEERWSGQRLTPVEGEALSAIGDIRCTDQFKRDIDNILKNGKIRHIYLDFDKLHYDEPDNEAYRFAVYLRERYPFIDLRDVQPQLRHQRTIKKPCEIAAMRRAEQITHEGIMSMILASRPGMFEYQYKAEFDYTLAQYGSITPGFQPIISAGANNFYLHYNGYHGQAFDGDMVLSDVGVSFDNQICDVSRSWPCNGHFSDRQRLLYECAYATSEHTLGLIKPGMPMADVGLIIRKYNYERLKEAGICRDYSEISTYMWHGGTHHIGYDLHDTVDMMQPLAPGMIICVEIGIYHEEWGIGLRLEDNCLITEMGCENLSAATSRSIEDIEAVMKS